MRTTTREPEGRRRPPACWLRRLLAASVTAAATAWAAAAPAAADLVVLGNGAFLKVSAWQVAGEKVRLELPSGGVLVMALGRVERIVEDLPAPAAEEPPALGTASFPLRFDPAYEPPEVPYGELIHAAAERHDLNAQLLATVVWAESAYRPRAVSHKGAQGLMQLMPATARRFGLDGERVFDPASNLDAGARYLRWLLERFDGDLAHALAGYNAGEGTVDRYGGVPPYRETRAYLRRIFAGLGLPEEALDAGARRSAGG